ncbi:MAG: hypothetical protein ACRDIV_08345 [Ktedonobacteraceae bacterium]
MQGSRENKQIERDTPGNEQDDMKFESLARKRPSGGMLSRVALIAALVLVLIAGMTIGAVAIIKNTNFGFTPTTSGNTANQAAPGNSALASNANGVVNFIDQPGGSGHSNAITISISNLRTPPSGSQYDAWFIDTSTKHVLALGALSPKDQAYTLTYSDNGVNLVGLGDEIEITLEHGAATKPAQNVLLSAAFPAKAFVYVRHMLTSYSTTPGHIGLLVGLIEQAKLLNSVAHSLTSNPNATATRCIAQAALDIMEGKSGADYKPLDASCSAAGIAGTGDGFGLLGTNGYIAVTQAQDLLANAQPDANSLIHEHSRHVTYGLQDMNTWLTTAQQDALALLNNPANSAKAQELATLANHAYFGYDANHDGKIDYVPGEAGSMISYQHGQFMTALVLSPN